MYLYIFEDGTLQQQKNKPTQEDLQAVIDGVLEIILFDIENKKFCGLDTSGCYDITKTKE